MICYQKQEYTINLQYICVLTYIQNPTALHQINYDEEKNNIMTTNLF